MESGRSSTHPSSLRTCRGPGGNKGQRGQCFKEETLHLLYLGGEKGGGGSGWGEVLLSPCDSHKLPPAPQLGIRIHTHEWTDTSATLSPAPSLFHKTLLLHLLPTPVPPKVSEPNSTKIHQNLSGPKCFKLVSLSIRNPENTTQRYQYVCVLGCMCNPTPVRARPGRP